MSHIRYPSQENQHESLCQVGPERSQVNSLSANTSVTSPALGAAGREVVGAASAENNPKMSSSIFCSTSSSPTAAEAAVSGSVTAAFARGLVAFSFFWSGDLGGDRLGDGFFGDNGLRLMSAPAFLLSKGTDTSTNDEKNQAGNAQTSYVEPIVP